jgi:hypothetical protein
MYGACRTSADNTDASVSFVATNHYCRDQVDEVSDEITDPGDCFSAWLPLSHLWPYMGRDVEEAF